MKNFLNRATLLMALLLGGLLALTPPTPAAADELTEAPWRLEADRLTYHRDQGYIIAEGDVLMEQMDKPAPEALRLQADWVRYDFGAEKVKAVGHLRIRENYDEVNADGAELDLRLTTGSFSHASLFRAEKNMYLDSDLLEKTGPRTYRAANGRVTTCPVEGDAAPAWSFRSSEIEFAEGGLARLKKVTFRIKGRPVFYLPYLLLPTRTGKKSGFLFPEYSHSERHGTGLVTPFLLNLSPSHDLTLSPGYYTERGGLAGVEYRYMLDTDSRGTLIGHYLDDRHEDKPGDEFKSDGSLRTNSDRFWIRGKADHDLGNNLLARLDIDVVSDRDFLQEFENGSLGYGQSNEIFFKNFNRGLQAKTITQRQNSLQLIKLWPTMDLQGEARLINDVADDPALPEQLWALPRLSFAGLLPLAQAPADLVWESEYINYWREEGLRAHRLDLHPQLVSRLPISPFLETAVTAGARETLYLADYSDTAPAAGRSPDDTASRTLFDFKADLATTVFRDYTLPDRSVRHYLRPAIGFQYIPDWNQADLPSLDSIDRISPRSWLTWNLINYLRTTGTTDPGVASQPYGLFKLSQVYDLEAADHPFSDLRLELDLRAADRLQLNYNAAVSMYGEGITAYSLENRYRNKKGDTFSLDYRYARDPEGLAPSFFSTLHAESQHELSGQYQAELSHLFSARFGIIQSFSQDETIESRLSLVYHPACWTMELSAARTPTDSTLTLTFSLAEIGKALEFGLPGI